MNLLYETLQELADHGHLPGDVLWVGDPEVGTTCTWEEFAEAASTVEYDSSWGISKINTWLVVVGKDWWLERGEYDGSEWWAYKRLPRQPELRQLPTLLGTARP